MFKFLASDIVFCLAVFAVSIAAATTEGKIRKKADEWMVYEWLYKISVYDYVNKSAFAVGAAFGLIAFILYLVVIIIQLIEIKKQRKVKTEKSPKIPKVQVQDSVKSEYKEKSVNESI